MEVCKGRGATARSKSCAVAGTSGSSKMWAIQNKIDKLTATLKSPDMGGTRPKVGKPGTPQKIGSGAPPNNPNNSAHKFKEHG